MDEMTDGTYLADRLTRPDNDKGVRSLKQNAMDIHGAHILYDAWTANNHGAYPIDHKRENAARAILARGHTTLDEILTVSYGEWPAQGLDIIGCNVQFIEIRDTLKTPVLQTPAGPLTKRAYELLHSHMAVSHNTTFERTLSFNEHLLSTMPSLLGGGGMIHSAMIHEGTHTVQRDHYDRLVDTFGRIGKDNSKPRILSDDIAAPYFTQKSDPVKLESLHGKNPDSRLTTGHEIQARLAQVIPDGYQTWQVMPLNYEQLLFALHNMGLEIPDEVMAEFEHSPTMAQTRKTFTSGAHTSPVVVRQLNKIIDVLTPEGKIEFWQNGIPALYADLIEMYGDIKGRARFGLGDNPRLALRHNQVALLTMLAHAPWQDVTEPDGGRAKHMDYSQFNPEQRATLKQACSVANIRHFDPQNEWPPPELSDAKAGTLWVLRYSELDKLERLQGLFKAPTSDNPVRIPFSSPILT